MSEHVILAAFLVIPLVLVVLLFSDEIIEEHRERLQAATAEPFERRHPLRRFLQHH